MDRGAGNPGGHPGSSRGYRPGRSPQDAMRKIWREVQAGSVWVVEEKEAEKFGQSPSRASSPIPTKDQDVHPIQSLDA